jgi:hypothetical protein
MSELLGLDLLALLVSKGLLAWVLKGQLALAYKEQLVLD